MSDAGHAFAPIPIKRAELAWWSALSADTGAGAFFSAWLAIQAGQLSGLRHAALIIGHPDTGPFETVAQYPEGSTPGPDLYDTINESLRDGDVAVSSRDQNLIIAYPLVIAGRVQDRKSTR